MKNYLNKKISCALAFGAILFTASCSEEKILLESEKTERVGSNVSAKMGVPTKFDQFEFANQIETYMKGKVAGFGYSIINDGQEYYFNNGGDGFTRKLFETNASAHGATKRQEIVRTTQYVTAVAILRVLEMYDMPLTTPAYLYLPSGWKPSESFKQVTFEHLLQHRSGLEAYSPPSSLKKSVELGLKASFGKYELNNANYELLALLLSQIYVRQLYYKGEEQLNKTFLSLTRYEQVCKLASMVYRDFVRKYVFGSAGLEHANLIDWKAWGPTGSLQAEDASKAYPSKTGTEAGLLKEDNTLQLECGATGLYISASQFVKLQYAISTFKVLGEATVSVMKQRLLGFDGKQEGTKGTYYWKRGDGKNCETIIFDFGKVQVAVFANSRESDISNPSVLTSMFEQSIYPVPVPL